MPSAQGSPKSACPSDSKRTYFSWDMPWPGLPVRNSMSQKTLSSWSIAGTCRLFAEMPPSGPGIFSVVFLNRCALMRDWKIQKSLFLCKSPPPMHIYWLKKRITPFGLWRYSWVAAWYATSANFAFSCSWQHRSVKTSEANWRKSILTVQTYADLCSHWRHLKFTRFADVVILYSSLEVHLSPFHQLNDRNENVQVVCLVMLPDMVFSDPGARMYYIPGDLGPLTIYTDWLIICIVLHHACIGILGLPIGKSQYWVHCPDSRNLRPRHRMLLSHVCMSHFNAMSLDVYVYANP